MNEQTSDLLAKIAARIHESRNIAVTSHLRPDGDSICTGLALYYMLQQMGKIHSPWYTEPLFIISPSRYGATVGISDTCYNFSRPIAHVRDTDNLRT